MGIWRIMDMFDRHGLKVTFLMNGLKVEQFAEECKEFQARGHEFSSESYEHGYSFMRTREQELKSIQKTVAAFQQALGQNPTGYLSPGTCLNAAYFRVGRRSGFCLVGRSVELGQPIHGGITGAEGGRRPLQRAGLQRLLDLWHRQNAA